MTSKGTGYLKIPTVTFTTPTSGVGTATGVVQIDATNNELSRVLLRDAGIGYTAGTASAITVSAPALITGIGTYQFGEIVTGSVSVQKRKSQEMGF